MVTMNELKILQSLDYKAKNRKSDLKVKQWIEYWGIDHVAVSVSGGLDSMALLHKVRSLYPDVKAVGVPSAECRENQKITEQLKNYTPLKPIHTKVEVIKKFGYPIGGKKIAKSIRRLQNPTSKNLQSNTFALTGLKGDGTFRAKGKIGKCWLKLVNKDALKKLILERIQYLSQLDTNEFKYSGNPNKAITKDEIIQDLQKKLKYVIDLKDQPDIKISEQCCYYTKEKPLIDYAKKYDIHYFTGEKASDGDTRQTSYLNTGCNSFKDDGKSKPFGPWMHEDILTYTLVNDIPMSEKYGDIIETNTGEKADKEKIQWLINNYKSIPELTTTKASRTGCFICGMGIQMEKQPNRFQRMEKEEPKLYKFAIETLGYGKIFDFLDIPYRADQISKKIDFGEQLSFSDINKNPTSKESKNINLVYKDQFDGKAKYHKFNVEADLQKFISHNRVQVIGWE